VNLTVKAFHCTEANPGKARVGHSQEANFKAGPAYHLGRARIRPVRVLALCTTPQHPVDLEFPQSTREANRRYWAPMQSHPNPRSKGRKRASDRGKNNR
jgi:hypothetical protein